MRPGRRFVLASVFLVLAFSGVSAKPKLTSTWAAPELAPIPNQKWLVLALVTEDTIKRTLEDAMVAELKKKKIDAIPAYASVTQADLVSPEALRARARELDVDAGVVFRSTGVDTTTQATPSVSAGVGIPVHVGMFSVFLGSSVPLGGGSKTVKLAGVKVEYYVADVEGPRWIGTYSIQIGGDVNQNASELAYATTKQLKKVKAIE